VPLPGALQVKLRAGDGVAYSSPAILHWGSIYGDRKRRTLHGGFAVPGFGFEDSEGIAPLLPLLSPHAQGCFSRWRDRYWRQLDLEEAALRSAMDVGAGARARFIALVDGLVPNRGEASRAHSIVLLSKAARRIYFYHHQSLIAEPEQEPRQEQQNTELHLCTSPNGFLQPGPVLYARFSAEEAVMLWECFAGIDAALQNESAQLGWEPGFQGGLSSYRFHEVPPARELMPRFGGKRGGVRAASCQAAKL
jgi:hypothetical protein